ncbi:MAG: phytoene/squalene synthase family protein [Hyphomicrobiales bacterium]
MSGASLGGAYAYCDALLREHDKDRFLADLFIPAAVRPHVQALHAFSFEIARVRDVVSEPMPGELRHQWWREVLQGSAKGDVDANPVAAALLDTIARFRLAQAPLLALIDARGFDLYDDPMPDIAALEGYCGDTSAVLFRLGAELLGAEPLSGEAAEHAGLAYAFAGLIRAFAFHAARGQVYLPGDILRRHGASPEEAIGGCASPALLAAIGDWRAEARRHLAAARRALAVLPKTARPAFLPLALVGPYLALTERRGYDPFRSPLELPQWRRQWALWRG